MKVIKIGIFVLLFMLNRNLYGQKIITDRPDQTESSSTIPKGSLQIESGLLFGFSHIDSYSESQFTGPSTLFRYGLTKSFEIRVVSQFEILNNKTNSEKIKGISDLELGVKVQLFQKEDVNTEIAFLSHMILPTGSKGLTNDKLGSMNRISLSHELNNKMGIGYNLGYNYFGLGKGDLTYSVVLGVRITEKAGIYLEPYGEIIEFDDHQANFDAGFTYLLKDNFQIDFSFGTGINNTMNYISIGFSWNIRELAMI